MSTQLFQIIELRLEFGNERSLSVVTKFLARTLYVKSIRISGTFSKYCAQDSTQGYLISKIF